MSVADVYAYAARLQKAYPNDIEPSFINELLHFRGRLKIIGTDRCSKMQYKIFVNLQRKKMF